MPRPLSSTAAQHQALLHFVGQGDRSDQQVLAKIRELVLPGLERHGEIEAWIIDDTAFPKKGLVCNINAATSAVFV
jgi:SRSO17 transposase